MNLVLVVVLIVIAKVPYCRTDVDDEISDVDVEYAILIPSFPKNVFDHACN